MEVAYTKNIFLDSSINTETGDGRFARWICPSEGFSVANTQFIKMTVNSFTMRRNWYNINQHNNLFYSWDPGADQYTPYTIAPGNYTTLTSVAAAIQTALQIIHGAALCTFDPLTRKFSLDMTGTGATFGNDNYFVGFSVKDGVVPGTAFPLPTAEGLFNDSFEVLGGIPTRTSAQGAFVPKNLFGEGVEGQVVHITYYVAALNTLSELCVRSSLQGGNYQSFGYEQNLPNASGLTNTDIIARIPIRNATWTAEEEFIHFEDFDDNFSVIIPEKQLSQFVFSVTDHKGRLLPQVAPGQAQDGSLSFRLSLKMSILNDTSSRDHMTLPGDVSQMNFSY
tara:strand:+ start:1813 stop:2823 length:1011 start_codon:yes stop_codon:yes gene_type:complete